MTMGEWRTIFLALIDDVVIAVAVAVVLLFLTLEGVMAPLAAALVGAASFLVLGVIAYKSIVALLMKPLMGACPVGKEGTAISELGPTGAVLVDGERWQAISNVGIKKGDRVVVVSAQGLKLTVEPAARADGTR